MLIYMDVDVDLNSRLEWNLFRCMYSDVNIRESSGVSDVYSYSFGFHR